MLSISTKVANASSMSVEPRTSSCLSLANITIRLVLGLTLSCAMAIQIGRAGKEHHYAFGLKACDGQICLQEIRLGVTGWDEAVRTLGGKITLSADGGESRVQIYPSADGKVVGRVIMQLLPDGSLSLADLLLLFGEPCKMSRQKGSKYMTLHYVSMKFQLHAVNQRLEVQSPVTFLQLGTRSDGNTDDACLKFVSQGDTLMESYAWRGLASLSRYSDLP